MSRQIINRSISVDGIDIFYREAGHPKNPSILVLHGFPTSSVMFKNLMTLLSDSFHLIAPDYPGFGFSAFPSKDLFQYTFANISKTISRFCDAIGLTSFSIYLHDYGCPIGLRLCLNHPQKVERIIVQNGNSYMEGIGPQWNETRDYWDNPTEEKKQRVADFLSEEGIKMQYYGGLSEALTTHVSPESWMLDWERMNRPGNLEMQFELNCDYKTNLEMFPEFQNYFQVYQPPALVIWGKDDIFFDVGEAFCYQRDIPQAQVHILDGGHMVLETNFDEVTTLIFDFMSSKITTSPSRKQVP